MIDFKEIQDIESSALTKQGLSSLEKEALKSYEKREEKKRTAKSIPFEYFYEDVISSALMFEFKPAIGDKNYNNAEKDALACLEISLEMRKTPTHSMPSWIQGALKFVDYIVLHYIQGCRNDIPKRYPKSGTEKSRYLQLADYSDSDIRVAGNELAELYGMRNKFEHRTIEINGRQELIRPNYNKLKREGTKLYSNALRRILKEYKKVLPEYIQKWKPS